MDGGRPRRGREGGAVVHRGRKKAKSGKHQCSATPPLTGAPPPWMNEVRANHGWMNGWMHFDDGTDESAPSLAINP